MASYRESIFLKRYHWGTAASCRLSAPVRTAAVSAPVSDGSKKVPLHGIRSKSLIIIIKFACHACPEIKFWQTNGCQCWGLAHPCTEVMPERCHSYGHGGRSVYRSDVSIQCGKGGTDVCPYNAIIHQKRPCAAACGIDAISLLTSMDEQNDYDKCVSCGLPCKIVSFFWRHMIATFPYSGYERRTSCIAGSSTCLVMYWGVWSQQRCSSRSGDESSGFTDVLLKLQWRWLVCATDEAKDFMEMYLTNCPYGKHLPPGLIRRRNFSRIQRLRFGDIDSVLLTGRLIAERSRAKLFHWSMRSENWSQQKSAQWHWLALTFEEMMGVFEAKHWRKQWKKKRKVSAAVMDEPRVTAAGGAAEAGCKPYQTKKM